MKTPIFVLVLILVHLLSPLGFCQEGTPPVLELEKDGTFVHDGNYGDLIPFLKEVEKKLPPSMIRVLNKPITLKFMKMDQRDSLKVPECFPSKEKTEDPEGNVYGFVRKGGSTVFLNKNFIEEILKGSSASTAYPCQHKNFYRKGMATIIHELTHLFFHKVSSFRGKEGSPAAIRGECGKESSFFPIKENLKQFRHLLNWNKRGIGKTISQANDNKGASPDSYEYTDWEEALPVNMEYFLLDEEFSCRRPAVHRFLKSFMGHEPSFTHSCQGTTQAPLTDENNLLGFKNTMRDLDPSRIYQIHYVLAGRGNKLQSLWGHSLYRLVICAPERKVVGPDCLQDTDHHLIFGFSARVEEGDGGATIWKGLTGHYPTRAQLTRYPEVLDYYTLMRDRDLSSFPLDFSPQEKEMFVAKMLENIYEYTGKYKVTSENCATLANGMLKCTRTSYNRNPEKILTPTGLLDKMEKEKILAASSLVKKDLDRAEDPFYTPPVREKMAHQMKKMKVFFPGLGMTSAEDYFLKGEGERKKLFLQIMQSLDSRDKRNRLLVRYFFSFWENALNKKLINDRVEKMKSFFKPASEGTETKERAELLRIYASLSKVLGEAMKSLPAPSYGIPTQNEFKSMDGHLVKSLQEKAKKGEYTQLPQDLAEFSRLLGVLTEKEQKDIAGSQGLLDFFAQFL